MKIPIPLFLFPFLFTILFPCVVSAKTPVDSVEYARIASYIKSKIPNVQMDSVALWTTSIALDRTHVAKDLIKNKSNDIPFPFDKSWLVMIDDMPGANFGHSVRWVFIKSDFSQHSPIYNNHFPPLIFSDYGKGKSIEFICMGLTSRKCFETDSVFHSRRSPVLISSEHQGCKYAVLVSGGINANENSYWFATNLKSMYIILRNAGFMKSHIYVYYADGSTPLDCDNLDEDNNDATGSEVTAGALKSVIRSRIQNLCTTSNIENAILFTYFSNHGEETNGVCLWDVAGDGLDNSEFYSPAELSADVANCQVLKHFMIHDECYSGQFLPMVTDGNHNNLVVYAASTATQATWFRDYMYKWEQNDISTTTLNGMHASVNYAFPNSTPCMAEGTPGLGNYYLFETCRVVSIPISWWQNYWYWVIFILVSPVVIWFAIKKKVKLRKQ